MKVRITWPDGTQTDEIMYQEYRSPSEMGRREDYYVIKEFHGATAKICVDQCCLKVERIGY